MIKMTGMRPAWRLALTGTVLVSLTLGGCSMAQLEEFNADLNDYGLVYEDEGPVEQSLPCRTRGGRLVAISAIRDSRQSLNVVNRGQRTAQVDVRVAGEVIRTWSLSPGARSETYYHSPNLTIEFETTC